MRLDYPFLIRGYAGPEYFCDRIDETLVTAISNGRDVTLVAPRRYGKTGLIHNAFRFLEKDHATVYLDIFAIEDLTSFVLPSIFDDVSACQKRDELGVVNVASTSVASFQLGIGIGN